TVLDGTTYLIGGMIYAEDPADPAQRVPVAGATVKLKDHAHETQTDHSGRYRFSKLLPGEYTLLVTTPQGDESERQISVPPSYNIVIATPPVTEAAEATAVEAVTTDPPTPKKARAPRKRTTTSKPKSSRRTTKNDTNS
ncbi:MAG: carboxypeptidase regulatory-like domain-containing protein, partial [Caldilineaceae bacterium]|nr:carboxypeptidase regulatory-like domain-containing protein [Caldilineaceae bacterium]